MEEAHVAEAPNGASVCSASTKMEEARVAEAPKCLYMINIHIHEDAVINVFINEPFAMNMLINEHKSDNIYIQVRPLHRSVANAEV
jgi:hypothetical protein